MHNQYFWKSSQLHYLYCPLEITIIQKLFFLGILHRLFHCFVLNLLQIEANSVFLQLAFFVHPAIFVEVHLIETCDSSNFIISLLLYSLLVNECIPDYASSGNDYLGFDYFAMINNATLAIIDIFLGTHV